MRTTLNLDETLIEKARKLSGIQEKTALIQKGLRSLIALESAKRLAKLGGTQSSLKVPSRRRPRKR